MTTTQAEIRKTHNSEPTYADRLADKLSKEAPGFPTFPMGQPYQTATAELQEALDAGQSQSETYVHLDPAAIAALQARVAGSADPAREVALFFSTALYPSVVQVDEEGDPIVYVTTADLAFS